MTFRYHVYLTARLLLEVTIYMSRYDLPLTNGMELRGDSCTIMEPIFGNPVWSDEFCWMRRNVAPAAS